MAAGWTDCKLGEVLTFQRGFDITKRQQRAGPYSVISSSGPGSTHDEFKVNGPGIVIGRKGTLGTTFFSAGPFWPHDTTLWVKDFHGNDERFAYYFLRTMSLEQYDAGASNPTLNRNHIHKLSVHYPPLLTQRKIAAVLSAYDDLIENNARRIELLEEMAQAIYREWFVHFRFPGHEKIGMADSPLGPIPEGWEVRKVSEVANVYRGRSYRSADLAEESGLPFLNLKCIERDGGFRRDGIKRYVGPYKENQTANPGDIIVAVTDMTQERRIVARAARVPTTAGQNTSVFSMDLVKLVPNDRAPSEYLYGMLRFSGFAEHVKQHANGVNVLHLSPSRIEEFELTLPTSNLRVQYAELCTDLYRQCDTLNMKNDNLRRTRDLLLPKLISGEVDVDGIVVDIRADRP